MKEKKMNKKEEKMNKSNGTSGAGNERGPSALLEGMPPAWRCVYDRYREGHAAALLAAQEAPHDAEAQAVLLASAAAVRLFRQEYQRTSTGSIARQLGAPG